MTDAFSVTGKRFLVTGGTRGIGRAISLRFAQAGANVIANYAHNEEAAQSLAAEASASGAPIDLCRGDLTSQGGRQRVLEALGAAPLSGLVHCAAIGVHRPLEDLTTRHWDFTFAPNVRAFFELVQALLPLFAPGSSIVGLSSEGVVHAFPYYTLVGASKGALEALCRHLAAELAPRGADAVCRSAADNAFSSSTATALHRNPPPETLAMNSIKWFDRSDVELISFLVRRATLLDACNM